MTKDSLWWVITADHGAEYYTQGQHIGEALSTWQRMFPALTARSILLSRARNEPPPQSGDHPSPRLALPPMPVAWDYADFVSLSAALEAWERVCVKLIEGRNE